jgi:hypothetical protein
LLDSGFRHAKLQDANFVQARLAGADFRGADFSGAQLCGADLSRANISGAKGLSKEMLADACVAAPMDEDAMKADPDKDQPVGIEIFGEKFRIPNCDSEKVCVR